MKSSLPAPGLQMGIFSSACDLSQPGVLETVIAQVSQAGYDSVEMGTSNAQLLKELLEKNQVKHAATHVVVSSGFDSKQLIRELELLDSRDVCNSGLLKWGDVTLDDYRQSIRLLNQLGQELKDAGIALHYHHHDFEFQPVGNGPTGMEILLEGLDPSCIDLCVDVGWVDKAGLNPAEFLREHAERIGYLHLKDHNGTDWTELGEGRVDFLSCDFAALPNLRHLMVEQDKTRRDPVESIKISRAYLRKNLFL